MTFRLARTAPSLLGLAALAAVLLLTPRSRAADLQIATVGGTLWEQLIAQIQDDPASEGRVYEIATYHRIRTASGVIIEIDDGR